MKIDFVIPWVDGGDPSWRAERQQYSNDPIQTDESRFRDWDLLRYWFRAVEVYAPWVNRIHFVTYDQIPSWMNLKHPKLHLVSHRDFIPEAYLPTFSSHTIELNFHRIPGLSEHFVYFNDDMLLNCPVNPEDFFRDGLPCDYAVMGNFCPMEPGDPYTHAQCNVMAVINTHFEKRTVLRSNLTKWFYPRYGRNFLKNVYGCFTRRFSNFDNLHLPSSMLRSTYEKIWALEYDLLDRTCRNKFRNLGDVNQYIMSYYNICVGNFHPRGRDFGKCYGQTLNSETMYQEILSGRHKTVCINDSPSVVDFEKEKQNLLSVYQQKLPHKSAFEL